MSDDLMSAGGFRIRNTEPSETAATPPTEPAKPSKKPRAAAAEPIDEGDCDACGKK